MLKEWRYLTILKSFYTLILCHASPKVKVCFQRYVPLKHGGFSIFDTTTSKMKHTWKLIEILFLSLTQLYLCRFMIHEHDCLYYCRKHKVINYLIRTDRHFSIKFLSQGFQILNFQLIILLIDCIILPVAQFRWLCTSEDHVKSINLCK